MDPLKKEPKPFSRENGPPHERNCDIVTFHSYDLFWPHGSAGRSRAREEASKQKHTRVRAHMEQSQSRIFEHPTPLAHQHFCVAWKPFHFGTDSEAR